MINTIPTSLFLFLATPLIAGATTYDCAVNADSGVTGADPAGNPKVRDGIAVSRILVGVGEATRFAPNEDRESFPRGGIGISIAPPRSPGSGSRGDRYRGHVILEVRFTTLLERAKRNGFPANSDAVSIVAKENAPIIAAQVSAAGRFVNVFCERR